MCINKIHNSLLSYYWSHRNDNEKMKNYPNNPLYSFAHLKQQKKKKKKKKKRIIA